MEENGERYLLENIVSANRLPCVIPAMIHSAWSSAGQLDAIPTIIGGLQQVRLPNISQLIENNLIQKSLFPAVRFFHLFLGDPKCGSFASEGERFTAIDW